MLLPSVGSVFVISGRRGRKFYAAQKEDLKKRKTQSPFSYSLNAHFPHSVLGAKMVRKFSFGQWVIPISDTYLYSTTSVPLFFEFCFLTSPFHLCSTFTFTSSIGSFLLVFDFLVVLAAPPSPTAVVSRSSRSGPHPLLRIELLRISFEQRPVILFLLF